MRHFLAAVAFAVAVAGAASADDKKIDPAKLIGKWELTKSESGNAPKGAIVEFMKGDKLTITIDMNGKEFKVNGTYKVEGDKLTVKIKPPGEEKEDTDTDTIKSLTADKLVLVDKDKKETELTKKK